MNSVLKSAIAKIQVGNKKGTAFVVNEDPPIVLTALHVLANIRGVNDSNSGFAKLYHPTATLYFNRTNDEGTFELTTNLTPDRVSYNLKHDQALITFEAPFPATPLRTGPATKRNSSTGWASFGFPRDAPKQGLAIDGEFVGTEGDQLYCRQAASGTGMKTAGLSGAPLIVENVAVGVIVESLSLINDAEATNRAGSLFFHAIQPMYEQYSKCFSRWEELSHLDALLGLYPAQFEVVLHLLKVPEHALSPPSTSQHHRATELLGYLGQNRLKELSDTIFRVGGNAP